MTVAALAASVSYAENGVTLNFAAPFRYLDPTHLVVERIASTGAVTALAYGTQWSATPGPSDAGGTVTLVASVAGNTLRIRRLTPRAQTADYVANDRFPAETHEAALDRAMLIDQEQDATIYDLNTRAITVPLGETAPVLPVRSSLLGKFLAVAGDGSIYGATGGAGDSGLRSDLATVLGGTLVSLSNGDTVQQRFDKLFTDGVQSYGAGGNLNLKYVHDDARWPMAQIGGIWSNTKFFEMGINRVYRVGEGTANGPSGTLFVQAVNEGSAADILPIMQIGVARANNTTVFGGNSIACSLGYNAVKLVPHEFDLEYSLTDTAVSSASLGLPVNVFSKAVSGAAFQTGAVGGTAQWGNGAIFYGISNVGSCLAAGAGSTPGCLFNSGAATYGVAAGVFNNTHRMRFAGTGASNFDIFADSGNNLRIVPTPGSVIIRNTTDTGNVFEFNNTGIVAIGANASVAAGYRLDVAGVNTTEGSGLANFKDSGGVQAFQIFVARGSPANAANAAAKINGQSVTGRSINAGGTINASGADYAEYERRAPGVAAFAKGDVVGFRGDGLLTDRFAEAVRFAVKSTNPNLVGGDAWCDMPARPVEPQFVAPDYAGAPEPSIDPPKEFPGDEMILARVAAREAAVALASIEADRRATKKTVAEARQHSKAASAHLAELRAAVDTRNEELFQQWGKAKAQRQADLAAHEEAVAAAHDQWLRTVHAEWLAACAAWDEAMELAREPVERIAYCGKVPCNFAGHCQPGEILVAVSAEAGGIALKAVPPVELTMADLCRRVGMVGKILPDGRPEVVVGVI